MISLPSQLPLMDKEVMQAPKPIYYKTLSSMHLLLSNDPPSHSELIQLSTLLHDVETDLAELATRPTVGESRMLPCEPLESLRKYIKAAMSLIRRLPDEIISEIFFWCLKTYRGRPWTILDNQRAPWTLTSVSQRWRSIALHDRRLWSSIYANARFSNLADPVQDGLQVCLARSGQHTLSIHRDLHFQSTHILSEEIVSFCERWKFLSLSPSRLNSLTPLQPIKGRLDDLYELYLRLLPRTDFERDKTSTLYPFNLFEVAPKLRKVTLYCFSSHYSYHAKAIQWLDPTRLVLPWHQLTNLRTDCLDNLHHCTQLIHCKLRIHRGSPIDTSHQIILPNLRNLIVENNPEVPNVLVLPLLESLTLAHLTFTRESIRSLVSRSRCTLKSLDVSRAIIRSGETYGPLLTVDCLDLDTVVVSSTDRDAILGECRGWRSFKRFVGDTEYAALVRSPRSV